MNLSQQKLCKVCEQEEWRYTCPRCGVQYCSLTCYKGHSSGCLDAFYRENVERELHDMKATQESQKDMVQILKRLHHMGLDGEEPSTSSDEEEGAGDRFFSDETFERLAVRFSGAAGDASEVELAIPEHELRQFRAAAIRGELSHLLAAWEPWWASGDARSLRCSNDGTALITDASESDGYGVGEVGKGEQIDAISCVPPLPPLPLPKLSSLTRVEPSPQLAFHLIDVLFCYCLALRLHNGDIEGDSNLQDALATIQASSSVLCHPHTTTNGTPASKETTERPSVPPSSVDEALVGCMERSRAALSVRGSRRTAGEAVASDVAALLGCGRAAVLCALQHLRSTFAAGARAGKQAKVGGRRSGELGRTERKLLFFLSWSNEASQVLFEQLQRRVDSFWREQRAHTQTRVDGVDPEQPDPLHLIGQDVQERS